MGVSIISCGGAEDRKEFYLEKAKNFIKENNLEKAQIEIKNSLQIDPKNAEGFFLLAEVKSYKKDLGGAIKGYKKAIELNPNYSNAKIALAKAYSITNYEEYLKNAESLLAEVKKGSGFNEKAEVVEATILIKRHKNSDAEKILKNTIEKNSRYINAYNTLGYLYLSENRAQNAIELFKDGLSKNPDNIELLMGLSDIYSRQKMYADAEQLIVKIINLNPEVYSYKAALATLYVSMGNIDKAENVLRSALDVTNTVSTKTLINFLAEQRSVQEAISELEKVVNEQPEIYENKYALGRFYMLAGRYDKAISVFEEIVHEDALSPIAIKSKVKIAEIYLKRNEIDKADVVLNEILEENRNLIDALFLKSKVDIVNNKFDDAINSLRLVIKEQPDHKSAPLLLANILKKQGQVEMALAVLQQSLDAEPGNYKGYIDFTNFLMSVNKVDQAEKVINTASELFKDNLDIYKQKFKILFTLNKYNEIEQMLEYMKSVMPARYEVFQLSGSYFIKAKKYDLAIRDIKLALSRAKEVYPVYRDMIKAYLMSGQKDKLYKFLESESRNLSRKVASLQALGDLYYIDHRYKKSEESYRKVLSIQPNWVQAYEGLIKLAVTDRKYEDAINYFKKAIDASSKKFNIKNELVKFYISLSKYSDADALYKEMLKERPYDVRLINNYIAFLLDYMNDETHLKQASNMLSIIEKHPNRSIQDTVAWYYGNTKRYKKSLGIYKKIINEKTGEADLLFHYGYVLFMSGDKQGAKVYLEKALKDKSKFVGKDKIKSLLDQI